MEKMNFRKLKILFLMSLAVLAAAGSACIYYVWSISVEEAIGQSLKLGVETDFYTAAYNYHVIIRTLQISFVVLCIFLILFGFYGILKRNISLKEDKERLILLNKQLREKEELFRTVFEQSPIGITFGNDGSDILDSNPMFEEITGRSREELAASGWASITHPDDLQEDIENFNKLIKGENSGYSMVKRYLKPDGSAVWVNMTIAPLKIKGESDFRHICIVEDITERKHAEEALRESERTYAMLLSNLPGMAYRCNFDRDWTMQFVSQGCLELTGYEPGSLLHNKEITFNDLISQEFREYLWNRWVQILEEKAVFREEYEIITASGEKKWVFEQGQGVYDEKGEVVAIEGLIIDISIQKKREDEIRYLNYHDSLTGLYNRSFFEKEIDRLDNTASLPLSVIIGDIDGLKLINDALGHAEGDKLITAMAKVLRSCCREGDIIARTGGDEFSILLPGTNHEEADNIIKLIGQACEAYKKNGADETYHMSISLGCATKTSPDEPISRIMKAAEDNMYRHKMLQNKSLHSSIVSSMKTTLYEKSQETEAHAQRLIMLSKAIGKKMDLKDSQLNELELLSTLHDIGKIGIKDSILNKPGRLTEEEWAEMKRHPEIGYRIAMTSPELSLVAEYILCHHENWDGSGYPQGLKGEEIPLPARILAVVDAYDAMTEDRAYRKAMTKEAAIAEIKKCAGTQFDPEIVRIFIDMLR